MKIAENISLEDLNEIDAYLLEQQSAEQKNNFVLKMESDPEWANKIETVRLLKSGITEAALKEKLQGYHQEINTNSFKSSSSNNVFYLQKFWWAAASVLIILAIGFFIFKNNKYENAYAQFYKHDPGLITVMGIADNYAFEEGMVQFKNEKFENALNLWEKPLKENPQNDTLLYFTGAAHQALHEKVKASEYFLQVLQQPNSAFFKDASWYQGLIYIEQKNTEKANILLLQSGRKETEHLLQKIK